MANPVTNYDVIIIGAGSIGAPAAFYLSRAGLKTLILDRFPSVGQSSNKKAIGGIRATHSDPAKIRLCQRSIENFSTWKEEYGNDIEWFKGGYSFPVFAERDEQILKDLLIIQKTFGLNINWLDKTEMLTVIPDLNPQNLLGGTFSPDDGNASPLLAIHAFYSQACKNDATFLFKQNVQEIKFSNNNGFTVKTQSDLFHSQFLINAAGPWATEIGKLSNLDLPVTPDSHEAAITEPVMRFLNPMVVDIRPAPGSSNYYFYQHYTGQIVFCITPSPQIWGLDDRETSSFLPMVARRMVEIMPRLQNIRIRRTWRGFYPMTPDGAPIIGEVNENPGLFLAVGMCGQGFMLGPGVGELLTRMITKTMIKEDEETLKILSPYRQFQQQEMLK
jgi:sarcosine oxidase subunit beta